jgi:hypothetical protein
LSVDKTTDASGRPDANVIACLKKDQTLFETAMPGNVFNESHNNGVFNEAMLTLRPYGMKFYVLLLVTDAAS